MPFIDPDAKAGPPAAESSECHTIRCQGEALEARQLADLRFSEVARALRALAIARRHRRRQERRKRAEPERHGDDHRRGRCGRSPPPGWGCPCAGAAW